jgi:hypothetical protein
MPGQFFCDEYGQKVVLIKWDMGMKFIDIEFGGVRLVRLDGPDLLIATGMDGAAPDGSHLSVRASRETGPVTYLVSRNGQPLHAMPTDYAMHPPVTELVDAMNSGGRAGSSQAGLSMDNKGRLVKDGLLVDDKVLTYAAGERKVDHGAIRNARIWLAIVGTLSIPIGFLVVSFGSLGAVLLISDPEIPTALKIRVGGTMIYMFIWLVTGVFTMVTAFRSRPSFSAAKLWTIIGCLPAVGFGWVIGYIAFKRYEKADEAADARNFNDDRHNFLGARGELR